MLYVFFKQWDRKRDFRSQIKYLFGQDPQRPGDNFSKYVKFTRTLKLKY